MKSTASILALAVWAIGLGACITATAPPQPLSELAAEPATTTAAASPPVDEPMTPDGASDVPPHRRGSFCHLAAPKLSDDACKIDADCAPSDPCHAKACVARAKARPPTPSTMCTQMMACETVDANRCGCYEGRCALIPPADPAKD